MGIQLYNEGFVQLTSLYSFTNIKGTLTLSNFRLTDVEAQILDIVVAQISSNGILQYSWDGQSPINLYPGDSIDITLRYYDPDMAGFWSKDSFMALVDAVVDDQQVCIPVYRVLEAGYNYYEQYAIIFDGVDVEPYYRDYYYPYYESWRENYR